MMKQKLSGSMKRKRRALDLVCYIFLIAICLVWLVPFFWLFMQSFRDGKGQKKGTSHTRQMAIRKI